MRALAAIAGLTLLVVGPLTRAAPAPQQVDIASSSGTLRAEL